MESTWGSRDLPVLEAAVRLCEELWPNAVPSGGSIMEATGLSKEEVAKSLRALRGRFLDVVMTGSGGDPSPWPITGVTSEAREVVGQWPTAEGVLERLINELQEAAEMEADPEKRSRLRTTAAMLGGSAKDLAINLLASYMARKTGIG